MSTETLVSRYQMLPPAAKQQVETLVEVLFATAQSKAKSGQGKRFTFDWAGGLQDLKEEFSAVELQHHISDLR